MVKNPLLFYVDDDSDDLMIFEDAANEIGANVKLFNNGDKLLQALNSLPAEPSMIFVDLNMPGKSGFDLISEIRSSGQWTELPLVVLSTASDKLSIEKCQSAGANYYIQKPTSIDKLKAALNHTLTIDWGAMSRPADFVYRPAARS